MNLKLLLFQFINQLIILFVFIGLLITGISCQKSEEQTFEELPEEERNSFEHALLGLKTTDGLDITLFASEDENMVINPTNMDIDERGRVWVTEGVNYRTWRNPQMEHTTREDGDRIVILEDTSGDGVADSQRVFYQGHDINAALGILVLHPDENGSRQVIISNSPNAFLLTDTTGDDQADTKELLFTGIGGEDHDHGVHAFVFGPDGKYYFNFGDNGGQILDADGNSIIDKSGNLVQEGENYRKGMVFRTNLDGSEFEVLGHNFRNNYEVALDSYGTLWQSDNDDDGNRSVRINFVMEYGNYGYTDEMTGAGWRTRRVNLEDTVHDRHWHQNDPGVVPNLLDTGSGSPTGIIVYEGDLLPEIFHNQMIHTEPLHNVVRAYPVEKDGAGYNASIENILLSTYNQRIRPVDVSVAPDGSLFVVDWYDPGVGGHRVADSERGRVYRIAPNNTPYSISEFNFSTPEGAIKALKSSNLVIRAHAWVLLNKWGTDSEEVLKSMWNSGNSRFRARALWLLSKIEGRGEYYIDQAIQDDDPDIRITGIRAARQLDMDIIPVLKNLMNDPSPQVRREVAIALRYNDSPEAPDIWAELTAQHDGEDRWYLEALGIAADRQWDDFFTAWLNHVDNEWNNPVGRDIIWRSRSEHALPLLADIINDQSNDIEENLRYFRAFHFHTSARKTETLISLLDGDHPQQDRILSYTLQQLDRSDAKQNPFVMQALNEALENARGSYEYLDLVERFQLEDKYEGLVQLIQSYPDSSLGIGAARYMLNSGEQTYLSDLIDNQDTAQSNNTLRVLGFIANPISLNLLESTVKNDELDIEIRQYAIEAFGLGSGGSGRLAEDKLLELAVEGSIPSFLEISAANVLMSSNREQIRREAANYLQTSVDDIGEDIRPVSELITLSGNVGNGRQIFQQSCQICHQVNSQGVNFGPDLSEIGTKLPKEGLYNKILQPDIGINFGYEGNVLTLENGAQVTGIIESETQSEILIRLPGGYSERYEKSQISSREVMDRSLMPSLSTALSENKLVDLVEYLSTLRVEN